MSCPSLPPSVLDWDALPPLALAEPSQLAELEGQVFKLDAQ